MEKKEQGILTVEASLVMGTLVLVILFIFSFARLYRAQSVISHAILQASDAVAMESYLRETVFEGDPTQIAHLANKIGSTTTVSADSFTSLRDESILPKIAKQKFTSALADSESGARQLLDNIGIKDNVDGIDFSKSYIDLDNNDVIIYADYTIKMQFPVFGFSEFKVSKAAKAKTFGEILFEIQTLSEDENKGTASGGGNYKHGTKIQISATPNYGYKFVSWNDGNTENPRTVTVAGAATYIAKFTEDQFGVTTKSSPGEGGTTSGAGLYNYLNDATVTATANAGYSFDKWVIYSHKDKKSTVIRNPAVTFNVNQSYTCTAYFNVNSYTVTVKTEGAGGADGASILYGSVVKDQNIELPYKSKVKLSAVNISGYKFLGWKEQGTNSYISTSTSKEITVPARNVTYVACYESLLRTVTFYNGDGKSVYTTRKVYAGNSLGSDMPTNPYYTGYRFNGWHGFNANTIVNTDMAVYGNWSYCTSHRWGHCGVKHYFGFTNHWYPSSSHPSDHYLTWASCIRCIDCKKSTSYRILCGTCWVNYRSFGSYSTYVGPNDCGSYNLP